MATLESLTPGATVQGLLPDRSVSVVQAEWHGAGALTLTYRDEAGRVGQELVYRDDEPRLAVIESGRAWSLDADGQLFRLVSEGKRISLAYLFDPFLAVQTSTLEPLPHQIDAVYSVMLDRSPLRFLLADDPGAGKTIMAGLLCKELMIRGDVERCLVIAPGSLVEQWQTELWEKFHLAFDIITRDTIEAARTGNPFAERPLLIVRLDHLARNEDLQAKLAATDWDLVVADEAHKMSAHYFGNEVKETKRYRIGQLAGQVARHLLLMTATPHPGKEEDFQLFMALLDADRFEGRQRDGVHAVDTSDLMRRLVKEKLLKFDGTPLFPERHAYSPTYPLSDGEALLYKRVTEYVQQEMNRAERLKAQGDARRGAVVGFALTTLQRRLASSPEAIYQSLSRRRKRLENRVAEERIRKRGAEVEIEPIPAEFRDIDDDFDVDDLPDAELEELEEVVVDQASAARTIVELEHEIRVLADLEELARGLRHSGTDRKWEELSNLLQHTPEMFDALGQRRKLIIFSEHRATLQYLEERLRVLLGRDEAVVCIHGGMGREQRRSAQEAFTQDKDVLLLIATDAAGEGINLQRAHLMVNYDLPWNPNRIEQRFGRVHRIGQTEVCHLWNLVAEDTREGQVFHRLFEKLEEQRKALGDQVFDVLGEAFRGRSLRDLLIDAIRYGEQPEVKQRLTLVVDATVGDELRKVVHERALVRDVMTVGDVERIRDEMERAEARKLQPHFIRSFFLEAFGLLGGACREREPGRFEITHVPAELRRRDRQIGLGAPLLRRYERITFDKELIHVEHKPLAEFVCPGHPILDGTIDIIIERYDTLLRQGTILVDDRDVSAEPHVLVYLQHAIQDGRVNRAGNRRVVSKRFEFVQVDHDGNASSAGWAPYLDCRPATSDELSVLGPVADAAWVRDDLERRALDHAVVQAREHLEEVRRRTVDRVDRTVAAVKGRLLGQIQHWDHRANQLKDQELAGKQPRSGMNSARARQRADDLEARLKRRIDELDAERQLAPLPPVVAGGALVVPAGLLARLRGTTPEQVAEYARETARTERLAVDAVLATEDALRRARREMPPNNKGYDIESRMADGTLLFIEVKGRIAGAETFTITRSEIGVGRNKPDQHILALVEVSDTDETIVRYLRRAFEDVGELPFDTISVNLNWKTYFERGQGAIVTEKKKLIEVALPLEAINRESVRENYIYRGNPSAVHKWWAQRPLAACRAVLFASLVDDPAAHPERFPTEEAQETERQRLFKIIEDLVTWENGTNERVLEAAHAEIRASCEGELPTVFDPFCGAGSIPLEAQRLGLDAVGSDLNPVAVLITKALIEIPPKFAGQAPVHPEDGKLDSTGTSKGARALAEDVRYYGNWMLEEAHRRIGHLYPMVTLPPDHGGGTATVIAWLWARTVRSPNPAWDGPMPLVRSFALSTKKGKETWASPVIDRRAKTIRFEIRTGPGDHPTGTVGRAGARCLATGVPVPLSYIREEGVAGRMDAQLMAMVVEGPRGRIYLPADADAERIARSAVPPNDVPDFELSTHPQYMSPPRYGLTRLRDLFTDRQLVAVCTLSDLVREARQRVISDGGAEAYGDAVAMYLAFAVDKYAEYGCSLVPWYAKEDRPKGVFARQAIPMVWDFAEVNPLCDIGGSWITSVGIVAGAIEGILPHAAGVARQRDAASIEREGRQMVCTDPPYYDNVPYADLSDFFYVWLRRTLKDAFPAEFSTLLVPKRQELVADVQRYGSRESAREHFESGMVSVFERIHDLQSEDFPITVFYAFRQAEESDGAGSLASTGWETMLEGLVHAGLSVHGTWPMRSERAGRMRDVGSNALASSIVLVCRPRTQGAALATRKELLTALKAELPGALRKLQQGNIAPVDLAQAAIGPGMAVFSRYARVVEADGSTMTVRTALSLINQVLDETLSEQEGDFDADTRWALAWFEETGMNPGRYGKAETLSKAKNTSIAGLAQAGLLESRAGNVRLLDRDELPIAWDPTTDARLTVWEVTQHLIRALQTGGEAKAGELLRLVGGLGETARELAYRLYTICERKKWPQEALAYNGLVVAWPEIVRLASTRPMASIQEELL